jgi:hypothetical protein
VLIDAVVHAVNEDYDEMAGDFIKLGFLSPGEPACKVFRKPPSCMQTCSISSWLAGPLAVLLDVLLDVLV